MKNHTLTPDPVKAAKHGKELFNSLLVVCYALAAARDDEFPKERYLEDLKYEIVDRALELVHPGFDGGNTTLKELKKNIADWHRMIEAAEKLSDERRKAKQDNKA